MIKLAGPTGIVLGAGGGAAAVGWHGLKSGTLQIRLLKRPLCFAASYARVLEQGLARIDGQRRLKECYRAAFLSQVPNWLKSPQGMVRRHTSTTHLFG